MAPFTHDRMIAAGWVPSRLNNKDAGHEIFGGNIVFRELDQAPDGTLLTKFPPEMVPAGHRIRGMKLAGDASTTRRDDRNFTIHSADGLGSACYAHVPVNGRISLHVTPAGTSEGYGMILRSDATGGSGYRLHFSPNERTVSLFGTTITGVDGLDKPFALDIVMKDDVIDVSIGGRRCIVTRAIEDKGETLWFYVKHGTVNFASVDIYK
jgi:hypothetical protein